MAKTACSDIFGRRYPKLAKSVARLSRSAAPRVGSASLSCSSGIHRNRACVAPREPIFGTTRLWRLTNRFSLEIRHLHGNN